LLTDWKGLEECEYFALASGALIHILRGNAILGACDVQLANAISLNIRPVALPAAALLLVLVLLITAFTGGVPG